MKKAWIVAGVKLVVGLVVLLCVVGARILMTGSGGVESDIAELARLESELADSGDSGASGISEPVAEVESESTRSVFERARASVAKRAEDSTDPNRMVSCTTASGRQFMSGADCAMRGGQASEI